MTVFALCLLARQPAYYDREYSKNVFYVINVHDCSMVMNYVFELYNHVNFRIWYVKSFNCRNTNT
jgi:hypothetical protein